MIEPKNPPRPEEKWARVKKDMIPFSDRIKRTVDSTKESLINNGIHNSTIENLIAAGFDMGQESMNQKMDELKSMYGTPVGEPMTVGVASSVNIVTLAPFPSSTPSDMERYWANWPETFSGQIFRHRMMGVDEPAISTPLGSFALMKKDHDFGKENYGLIVMVKPVKEYYMTVEIVS
jgi:hypothetical protein